MDWPMDYIFFPEYLTHNENFLIHINLYWGIIKLFFFVKKKIEYYELSKKKKLSSYELNHFPITSISATKTAS
jgi:hypothetical protein